MLHSRPADSGVPSLAGASIELRTARAAYRVWTTLLGEHLAGPGPALLVQIERLTPEPPSLPALRERWGLTRQEARVARLLARGVSGVDDAAWRAPGRPRARAARPDRAPHTRAAIAAGVAGALGPHAARSPGRAAAGARQDEPADRGCARDPRDDGPPLHRSRLPEARRALAGGGRRADPGRVRPAGR